MFSTLNPPEPMIMVHRGWHTVSEGSGNRNASGSKNITKNGNKNRRNTEPALSAPNPLQTFEFVNFGTTTPKNKDPNVRKLVRAHVVKDWSRRKKIQRLQLEKLKGRRIEPSAQLFEQPFKEVEHILQSEQLCSEPEPIESLRTPLPSPQITQLAQNEDDPFGMVEEVASLMEIDTEVTGPVAQFTQQRTYLQHRLNPDPDFSPTVYHIRTMGNAMFPLNSVFKFNPLCPDGCVGWHLNDDAVIHGILYTTTSYASLISGVPESKDAFLHVAKTVAIVNKRLQNINELGNGAGVDEGIIGAVSCIALAEALRGNVEGWKLHMSGVKHLVLTTGGINGLSNQLRFKLYRADLIGAIGSLASPFFSGAEAPTALFPRVQSSSMIYSPTSPINNNLRQILAPLPIPQSLTNALFSISDLCRLINEVLSHRGVSSSTQQETMLDQSYSIQYSLLKPWSGKYVHTLSPMEEVLRIAGLLYVHAIWQDFPFATLGPSRLLKRLKELVMTVEVENEREESLIVWMLFVGAITAAEKGDSRIWFIAQLQRLTNDLSLDNWEVVKEKLEGLWWVDKLHGEFGRGVWNEVVVLNSVLVGDYMD